MALIKEGQRHGYRKKIGLKLDRLSLAVIEDWADLEEAEETISKRGNSDWNALFQAVNAHKGDLSSRQYVRKSYALWHEVLERYMDGLSTSQIETVTRFSANLARLMHPAIPGHNNRRALFSNLSTSSRQGPLLIEAVPEGGSSAGLIYVTTERANLPIAIGIGVRLRHRQGVEYQLLLQNLRKGTPGESVEYCSVILSRHAGEWCVIDHYRAAFRAFLDPDYQIDKFSFSEVIVDTDLQI
ncbi:MAG: hypothetical protein NXH95_14445 [Pseudomonadaceae bacterium]|nr:hypothetical protein [Pseudomonadaceae bacterium]